MAKEGKICRGPSHARATRLPFSAFSKDRAQKDGFQNWCRDCQAFHREERAVEREEVDRQIDRSKKVTRQNWPKDEVECRTLLKELLLVSLVENEGDLIEVSECLNRSVAEILDFVRSDEELGDAWSKGLDVRAIRAESVLYRNVNSGKSSDVKMALTNLSADRWSDRTKVELGGYEPAPKELGSVLEIVRKEESE